jgi:SecD/SecF fusion protein
MQLKGLVRIFAILLILFCVYQLSFTWIVRSHESDLHRKAETWTKSKYIAPEKKYPDNEQLRNQYTDTVTAVQDSVYRQSLIDTRDTHIGLFGSTTYSNAKDKELNLGLDLQGGISVTMEVGMDELIKVLAKYTKDPQFNQALNTAVQKKANGSGDLVASFIDEYKKINPTGNLALFFYEKSNDKLKFNSSNDDVKKYLSENAKAAFDNTVNILRRRIDRFGLSSPNINPNPAKQTINIELAGAKDPERVRNFLQSTANLQFFEVYTFRTPELKEGIAAADKALQDYLNNDGVSDSLSHLNDTAKKADTANKIKSTHVQPLISLLAEVGAGQNFQGKVSYPARTYLVKQKDTALVNTYLRLDIVKNKFPSTLVFMYGKEEKDATKKKSENLLSLYAIKTMDNGQAELEGDRVKDAMADVDERGNSVIRMIMDQSGGGIWGRMTTKAANENNSPIAIVLDNFVYSAPRVDDAITTGTSQISGSFSSDEAKDLSEILKSGKLPAPAKIVQQQVVGATLGQEAISGGGKAFLVSFIIIFALMLLYYNSGGWVANIALVLNILFTVGILSALGFTLTAAGIAGLVLTIGMAVDTNVIIFERIKEELIRGKGYQTAINDGYRRSYAPVLDAHVTTFLTAFILFNFGVGPVLGFATTQMIGIALSLFCGILVSRLITDWYTNKQRHLQYFTTTSKKIFKHASFKFIEYRKVAYGISVVVLILGVGSFFNGFDEGVEFAGGRSYTIKFAKDMSKEVEPIRDDLKKAFGGEAPLIKTVGSNNQLDITTAYLIKETSGNVDSTVQVALYNGLQKYLPAGTTLAEFESTKFKQNSQMVQPSISNDLKRGAQKATIISIIIICLYIFIRFRDWRYSLGTIVALLHDVFVTLAVFSFCRKIVPFPLEIDQHFIAAILTVIGFSMNDTVIVYDRIREDSRLHPTMPKAQLINTAINQTLSRTIMTSLTVFLTILILFIFGGEVTRGFAFAMLVGVVTGTYSSIFVAAPILVDFAKDKPLGQTDSKKK